MRSKATRPDRDHAKRLTDLEAFDAETAKQLRELRAAVGAPPSIILDPETGARRTIPGTGIAGELRELRMLIGDAPNPAADVEGSGMVKVLGEIRGNRRSHVALSGTSVAAVAAIVVLEVLTRLGVVPPPHSEAPPPPRAPSVQEFGAR